jgi:hypothetical protein
MGQVDLTGTAPPPGRLAERRGVLELGVGDGTRQPALVQRVRAVERHKLTHLKAKA